MCSLSTHPYCAGIKHTGCDFTEAEEDRKYLDGLPLQAAASVLLWSQDQRQNKDGGSELDVHVKHFCPSGTRLSFLNFNLCLCARLSPCVNLRNVVLPVPIKPALCVSEYGSVLSAYDWTYEHTHCAHGKHQHPHSHTHLHTYSLPHTHPAYWSVTIETERLPIRGRDGESRGEEEVCLLLFIPATKELMSTSVAGKTSTDTFQINIPIGNYI